MTPAPTATETTDASFPLLTEPWIPVLRPSQHTTEEHLGLADVLTQAHRLKLAATGIERAVLLRFLAAVFDAAAGPATTAQWDTAWHAPTLPTDQITAYLARWRHRFDLLGPAPFAQCAELTEANRTTHALVPGSWSGHGGTWFNYSLRAAPQPTPPADAAIRLLTLQALHPGGIQSAHPTDPHARSGKIYGGKPGPLSLITHLHLSARGATLKDELLLNLPPQPRADGDAPVWERPAPVPHLLHRDPAGRLDLLTWPTRRIRLLAGADGHIHGIALHDGDRTPDPRVAARDLDPMTATTARRTQLALDDRAGHTIPWAPALLLPRDGSAECASPLLQHALAAAERCTLPADLVLTANAMRIEHTTLHHAAIAANIHTDSVLGRAGVLVTPTGRAAIAAAAHLPLDVHRSLVTAAANVLSLSRDALYTRQDASLHRYLAPHEQHWRNLATDPHTHMRTWTELVGEALERATGGLPSRGYMSRASIDATISASYARARETAEAAALPGTGTPSSHPIPATM